MNKLVIITTYLFLTSLSFSQNIGSFNVSFEGSLNQFKMAQLNSFLLDTNYNGVASGYYDTPPTNEIRKGYGFGLSVNYQPLKFQSFGLYGGYQYGSIKRNPQVEYIVDPITMEKGTLNGTFTYSTKSILVGITTTTYLDALIFDTTSHFWKRASWGIELNAGVGYAMLRAKQVWASDSESIKTETYSIHHNALDFQAQISMKFGYQITKSNLLSTVGVKFGYQYFKTKNVKNDIGSYIFSNNKGTSNLDFSGLFGGVYLTIGK